MRPPLAFLFVFFLHAFYYASATSTPLSGVYTINPSLAASISNYQSFGAAVSALKSRGISGPVTFNIVDTLFNEQVFIHDVTGISSTNTISFQSDPANSKMPKIFFAANNASDNFVMRLESISHLSIKGITIEATGTIYGKALVMSGNTHHITIEGDSIKTMPFAPSFDCVGITAYPTQDSICNDSISIINNTIIGGNAGVKLGGILWVQECSALVMRNNTLKDWCRDGIYITDATRVEVNNNTIDVSSNCFNAYGLTANRCRNSEFSENHIYGSASWDLTSFLLDRCISGKVLSNKISTSALNVIIGLVLDGCDGNGSDYPNSMLAANNMISVTGDTNAGVYGLCFDARFFTYLIHNSVGIYGDPARSVAFYHKGGSGFNQFYNNSFVNHARGYAVYADNFNGVDSLNFNNYYTNGPVLGHSNSLDRTDLSAWKLATGFDHNSLSGNPVYQGFGDLHASGNILNNKGKHHAFVTIDFDRDTRSILHPDIGADEFNPALCQPPVAITTTSSGTTDSSIFVSWLRGSGLSYDIEHGLGVFPRGAGILDTGIQDTFYSAMGLRPNTEYCFYIRSYCPSGDTSAWVGPYCFTTDCSTLIAPFHEGFTSGGIPECWPTFNMNLNQYYTASWLSTLSWRPGHGATGKINNTPGGGYAVGVAGVGHSITDTAIILESPLIDVSRLWNPALTFDLFINNIHTANNQTLYIDVFDGSVWDKGVYAFDGNNPLWRSHTVPLHSYLGAQLIKIRFRVDKTTGGTTPYYSDIVLDNVVVNDIGCNIPDSLSASLLSCDSVSFAWSSSDTSAYSLVEYGPTGFVPGNGTTALAKSPMLLSNLQKVPYDFYVADTCINDTTPHAGPYFFFNGLVNAHFTSIYAPVSTNGQTVHFSATPSTGATGYAWFLGDGSTDTGLTISHTYQANGSYIVDLQVSSLCDTTFYTDTLTIAGIGLTENTLEKTLRVYPNPFSDVLHVAFKSSTNEAALIRILDLSGKTINRVEALHRDGNYQEEIPMDSLAKGIYILSIQLGKSNTGIRKIIKN